MAPVDQLWYSRVFLGLKWQKDNTSVKNLECKSTNTNGSVCTVWFQVSNRLYYSCYHLSIRGLRQWNFCIYHVTRQLLEHFCKLHSAKMRHIVEYAEVTVTGNSLVWSTSCIIFSGISLLWDALGKSLSWQKWLNSFYNSTMTDDDDWLLLTISEVFETEVLKKIGESGHVWFLPHQVFHCFSPIVCDRTRIYILWV